MILYVCKYSNLMASARYRGYGWRDRLQTRGYSTRLIYAQRSAFVLESFRYKVQFLCKLILLSTQARILIFQKYIPPIFIQKMLAGKRIVFDFDDRIYEHEGLRDRQSRIYSLLQLSSTIIVSVQTLHDELIQYLPELSEKLVVIPTLIDWSKFRSSDVASTPSKETSKIVIGWIGSSPGLNYLRQIEVALFNLWQEFPTTLELVVVCNQPYQPTHNFPIQNIQWSLAQELDYFNHIDISIMPLDRTDRARGKAGFKAIQSLAAGVPVVASAIGFNQEIIQHGENGFLADSPDDFYQHLKRLVTDHGLRDRMATAARESAKHYDYSVWEDRYIQSIFC